MVSRQGESSVRSGNRRSSGSSERVGAKVSKENTKNKTEKQTKVRKISKGKKISFEIDKIQEALVELCTSERYGRYRISVRKMGSRILLYDSSGTQVLASFYIVDDNNACSMIVTDPLVRVMINEGANKYLKSFYKKFGAKFIEFR